MSDFTKNKHEAKYFYIMHHIKTNTFKFGVTNYLRDRRKQVNAAKPAGLVGWKYVTIIPAGGEKAFKLEMDMQRILGYFNFSAPYRGARKGDCRELYKGLSSNTIRAKLRSLGYKWGIDYKMKVFANQFDGHGHSMRN